MLSTDVWYYGEKLSGWRNCHESEWFEEGFTGEEGIELARKESRI